MQFSAILAIGYRDLLKFLRDPGRIVASMVFPLVFIGILGGSLQANLGTVIGYDLLAFSFTGVFAQTLFQSSALGIISLIEDRENDFSQEMFVSPISRYAIVFGKIVGESAVALLQGIAILLFGIVIGVPISALDFGRLVGVGLIICLLGGSFGVLTLSGVGSQRAANQVFPVLMLPQFFLAGVFSPIKFLPLPLDILSRLAPLRYAVDLTRNVFYGGRPEEPLVILQSGWSNLLIVAVLFGVFLVAGTWLFVRRERNR